MRWLNKTAVFCGHFRDYVSFLFKDCRTSRSFQRTFLTVATINAFRWKLFIDQSKTKRCTELPSKVLRADGRLVNLSEVFCTNNAQAVARNCFNIRSTSCVCLLVLRWKRGRELVHCLYKNLQTWVAKIKETLSKRENSTTNLLIAIRGRWKKMSPTATKKESFFFVAVGVIFFQRPSLLKHTVDLLWWRKVVTPLRKLVHRPNIQALTQLGVCPIRLQVIKRKSAANQSK